jgi:hypothetical protein
MFLSGLASTVAFYSLSNSAQLEATPKATQMAERPNQPLQAHRERESAYRLSVLMSLTEKATPETRQKLMAEVPALVLDSHKEQLLIELLKDTDTRFGSSLGKALASLSDDTLKLRWIDSIPAKTPRLLDRLVSAGQALASVQNGEQRAARIEKLAAGNVAQRVVAASAVASHPTPTRRDVLIRALYRDKDPTVQTAAAEALPSLSGTDALSQALTPESIGSLAIPITVLDGGLRRFTDSKQVASLLTSWAQSETPFLRYAAARLAVHLPEGDSRDQLIQGLLSDATAPFDLNGQPVSVSQQAADMLRQVSPTARGKLIANALKHPSASIRASAVMGLDVGLPTDTTLPLLEKASQDDSPEVLLQVANRLMTLPQQTVQARLLVDTLTNAEKRLQAQTEAPARRAFERVMEILAEKTANLTDEQVKKPLIETLLKHQLPAVRSRAIRAAASLSQDADKLKLLQPDGEREPLASLRQDWAHLAGSLSNKQQLATLISDWCRSDQPATRALGAEALALLPDTVERGKTIEALLKAQEDEVLTPLFQRALPSLPKGPDYDKLVVQLQRNPDLRFQRAAAQRMAQMSHPDKLYEVFSGIFRNPAKDYPTDLRAQALQVFCATMSHPVAPTKALWDASLHEDPLIRRQVPPLVLRIIQNIGVRNELMRRLARDRDPDVLLATAMHLHAASPAVRHEIKQTLLAHPDPPLRTRLAWALLQDSLANPIP